jgi:general secretion pathway protein E
VPLVTSWGWNTSIDFVRGGSDGSERLSSASDPSLLRVPLGRRDGSLVVATGNPFNWQLMDAVSAAVRESVLPVVVLPDELARLVKIHLGVGAETIDDLVAIRDHTTTRSRSWKRWNGIERRVPKRPRKPRWCGWSTRFCARRSRLRASDIHLEAQGAGMKIRYRIDGVCRRSRLRRRSTAFKQPSSAV